MLKNGMVIQGRRIDVFELGQINPMREDHEGSPLSLRIEIYEHTNDHYFYAHLWRMDYYRMQPSFPSEDGAPVSMATDELVMVSADYLVDEGDLRAKSVDQLLTKVTKRLREKFSPKTS